MALPTLPATNCWTKAEDALARSIANSLQFQILAGVQNDPDPATSAEAYMYINTLPDPASGEHYTTAEWPGTYIPHCLISTDREEGGFSLSPRASLDDHQAAGRFLIKLVRLFPTEYSAADADRLWQNYIGDIMDDMRAYSIEAGGYGFSSLDLVDYGREQEDRAVTLGDTQVAILSSEWNDLSGDEAP